MSDSRRVYRRIMSSLKQLYPSQRLNGHQIRHLNTLAAMIAGIVQSQSCHLEKMAGKVTDQTQVASRAKRFKRFVQHDGIDQDLFFMPFIVPLVQALASSGPLTVAMDGSEVGRDCIALMVSVIYRKRAIPLAWVVREGSKGHWPEEAHLHLLNKIQALLPTDCEVIFLGDGEFDGVQLQAALTAAGWEYVCRTAKNSIVIDDGDEFALSELALAPGECIDMPNVRFTRAAYGPVLLIAWWRSGYDEPLYLVSNMACVGEACSWYRRRFRIETFFSDQKSRGFNLQKSHLSAPERLQRLLLATCLAYIWIIYLGVQARSDPKTLRQIHRADRCDLSLFQLGLRYLNHLICQGARLPFSLVLPR